MHLWMPMMLASLLFGVGTYGVLARRNAVLVLMAVELMLNAGNLLLVTFSAYLRDAGLSGQVGALFVIVIAAAEIGVGLAIVLAVFRLRRDVAVDRLRDLADPLAAQPPVAPLPPAPATRALPGGDGVPALAGADGHGAQESVVTS